MAHRNWFALALCTSTIGFAKNDRAFWLAKSLDGHFNNRAQIEKGKSGTLSEEWEGKGTQTRTLLRPTSLHVHSSLIKNSFLPDGQWLLVRHLEGDDRQVTEEYALHLTETLDGMVVAKKYIFTTSHQIQFARAGHPDALLGLVGADPQQSENIANEAAIGADDPTQARMNAYKSIAASQLHYAQNCDLVFQFIREKWIGNSASERCVVNLKADPQYLFQTFEISNNNEFRVKRTFTPAMITQANSESLEPTSVPHEFTFEMERALVYTCWAAIGGIHQGGIVIPIDGGVGTLDKIRLSHHPDWIPPHADFSKHFYLKLVTPVSSPDSKKTSLELHLGNPSLDPSSILIASNEKDDLYEQRLNLEMQFHKFETADFTKMAPVPPVLNMKNVISIFDTQKPAVQASCVYTPHLPQQ